jgi:molybdate transport system substrate-binding protein
MNKALRVFLLVGGIALSQVRAGEVSVFAAASLTDALQELGKSFEAQTANKVTFNFAASSLLARQISEHAPADIFFSADEAKMDDLQKSGLIVAETRKDLLSNSLVIVVPADSNLSITSPEELEQKTKKIAVADPRAVPAGIYTKEYLSGLGLWAKLEPKVIPTENVRAALAAVESGNVEVGFIYKSDTTISKKVKIAYEVPPDKGPKIRYPIAIVKEAKNKKVAEAFLLFLQSQEGQKTFERYGFPVKL